MSHTRTDTRDQRAIATTACPRCHAPEGEPCKRGADQASEHRPGCCNERRRLWSETKRGLPQC